jgi:hypothetical protein
MKANIEIARFVLAKMYDCEEHEIVLMETRKRNVMIARRFFIYYLWKHCNIKHLKMKEYIVGAHHATSIHHCRKFEFEVEQYKEIRKEWISFLYYADNREWQKLKIDMRFPIDELDDIIRTKKLRDNLNKLNKYENYGKIS